MKTLLKILFVLFLLIFISLAALIFWLNKPAEGIKNRMAEFEIVKGDTAYSLADRLYYRGVINSKTLFIMTVRILKLDKQLKTGWKMINPDSTTIDVIETVYSGDFITISFTVPEGTSINQLKEILVKNNIAGREELNDFFEDRDYTAKIGLEGYRSAEGFLFPDTYKFYKGVSLNKVFSKMVDQFYIEVGKIYPDYKKLSRKDFYDKIILASIIEEEVKVPEEAPIVAGVFYNRLKKGMKIQSCATIQYILGKPREQLLLSDLKINNPYNTYLYSGLPPAPISSPGRIALNSAFHPANHDYLFFVVKDPIKGLHHFSKTYTEHLNAQKKYKAIKGFY